MQIRTKGEELIKIKQEGSDHCYPCNNQQTLGFNASTIHISTKNVEECCFLSFRLVPLFYHSQIAICEKKKCYYGYNSHFPSY